MRKLLLINPGHLAAPVWGWRSFPAHLHHLWSALNSGTCTCYVSPNSVDVVDYNALFGAPVPEARGEYLSLVHDDLSKRAFDIAGISCWSSLNVTASYAIAKFIRELKPDVPIIVGGYHPSARPEDFPADLFDVVVRGCGIGTLRSAMEKTGDITLFFLKNKDCVPGFCELVKPRWEGFPYGAIGGAVGIYLSRGCPYHCSFCMESVMGRRWTALDPIEAADAVVEAINVTKTPFLQFYDPLFGLNPRWRRAFLDALVDRRKRFDKKTFLWAQVRSDTITQDDVKKLRKFRVQLAIGLESASGEMLKIMNKTRSPDRYLKKFAEMSEYLDRKKVHHQVFLIFNHPGETPETLDEARSWLLNMLSKKRKSYLTVLAQKYVYFPGSPLDEKLGEFQAKYGTKILHPTWWLEEEDHYGKAGAVVPSQALEKAGHLERWQHLVREVNAMNLEVASKTNRPDVETFRNQFGALNTN